MQIGSSTNRNLYRAFYELNLLKDKLGLSDAIIEKTAYIYRKVEGRGLVRGRTIPAMIGKRYIWPVGKWERRGH